MLATYIKALASGHFEYGIVKQRPGGPELIKKGIAGRREDAERLVEHLGGLNNRDERLADNDNDRADNDDGPDAA